jgi:drug/metabolite transporter (DMT)-like permease
VARADLLLFVANVVYATSYVVTRVALAAVPPATLALLRFVIGGLLLFALAARTRPARPMTAGDRLRVVLMGVVGFAGAAALSHWGLALSTATNGALLIVVEPLTLLLLGPVLLNEHLSRREWLGAAGALAGATLVVVNGVPGLTAQIVPHWRGDLLLILSGAAYAAYSLLGRPVLARHPALPVTASSILWGVPALVPLAALEWMSGWRPVWTAGTVVVTLYLALVITALGYLIWNWALERTTAARAGIFVNVQPVVGAALGVVLLGEPLTPFTLVGGALVVVGLCLTVRSRGGQAVYSRE